MTTYNVQNAAPERKYFTMMLNIADDDLDPFEYRLLAHFTRWSYREDYGTKSLRQMAEATRMSVNKVRSTLASLEAKGYITVKTPTEAERRAHQSTNVTIVDRWAENITRCQSRETVSDITQSEPETVSNMTQSEPETVSNMTQLKERGNKSLKERRHDDENADANWGAVKQRITDGGYMFSHRDQMEELRTLAENITPDDVTKAIEVARQKRKQGLPYVLGILRNTYAERMDAERERAAQREREAAQQPALAKYAEQHRALIMGVNDEAAA